ncbi:hypothetical protein [Leptospira andrefontaineae]|uniref:hypothetical protein n=1 Tax=Leptospira andrefontaineae TaxID=2484976 RepID=UPI001ABF0E94|nr:hypothetical protein [Leptospira andrefontaineae]
MKPPSLEQINKWQVRRGEKGYNKAIYNKIVFAFTDKDGNFQNKVFSSYRPAIQKEGIRLFSMKFRCPYCKTAKSFTHFRYAEEVNGFYEGCKDCNIPDYQGFVKFNKRRVNKGSGELTLAKYKSLKSKYFTRFGNLNPHIIKAIDKMAQVFGRKVLTQVKPCDYCSEPRILALFTPDYKKKRIYGKCRICSATDQARRRAEARKLVVKKAVEKDRVGKRRNRKDGALIDKGGTVWISKDAKSRPKSAMLVKGR